MNLLIADLSKETPVKTQTLLRYLCRPEFTNHIFYHHGVLYNINDNDILRLKELINSRNKRSKKA